MNHMRLIGGAQAQVDCGAPAVLARPPPLPRHYVVRKQQAAEAASADFKMIGKIAREMARPPVLSHLDRKGPISLNVNRRRRELQRIDEENLRLLQRLESVRPSVLLNDHHRSYVESRRHAALARSRAPTCGRMRKSAADPSALHGSPSNGFESCRSHSEPSFPDDRCASDIELHEKVVRTNPAVMAPQTRLPVIAQASSKERCGGLIQPGVGCMSVESQQGVSHGVVVEKVSSLNRQRGAADSAHPLPKGCLDRNGRIERAAHNTKAVKCFSGTEMEGKAGNAASVVGRTSSTDAAFSSNSQLPKALHLQSQQNDVGGLPSKNYSSRDEGFDDFAAESVAEMDPATPVSAKSGHRFYPESARSRSSDSRQSASRSQSSSRTRSSSDFDDVCSRSSACGSCPSPTYHDANSGKVSCSDGVGTALEIRSYSGFDACCGEDESVLQRRVPSNSASNLEPLVGNGGSTSPCEEAASSVGNTHVNHDSTEEHMGAVVEAVDGTSEADSYTGDEFCVEEDEEADENSVGSNAASVASAGLGESVSSDCEDDS